MKKIIKFECKICHTVFDSEEDCYNCEASHHDKLYIKSMCFSKKDFLVGRDNIFPYKIVVSDVDQNVTKEYFINK